MFIRNNASRRKRQIAPRFTRHSRIVGPQYRICLMSPFWHLELGGDSYIFVENVDPCSKWKLRNSRKWISKPCSQSCVRRWYYLLKIFGACRGREYSSLVSQNFIRNPYSEPVEYSLQCCIILLKDRFVTVLADRRWISKYGSLVLWGFLARIVCAFLIRSAFYTRCTRGLSSCNRPCNDTRVAGITEFALVSFSSDRCISHLSL
jgi:hypothetical protein